MGITCHGKSIYFLARNPYTRVSGCYIHIYIMHKYRILVMKHVLYCHFHLMSKGWGWGYLYAMDRIIIKCLWDKAFALFLVPCTCTFSFHFDKTWFIMLNVLWRPNILFYNQAINYVIITIQRHLGEQDVTLDLTYSTWRNGQHWQNEILKWPISLRHICDTCCLSKNNCW